MWASRCSTLTRCRSSARPWGIFTLPRSCCCRFSSSAMNTERPRVPAASVHWARRGQGPQTCGGICTPLPSCSGWLCPAGQVSVIASRSSAKSSLRNRGLFGAQALRGGPARDRHAAAPGRGQGAAQCGEDHRRIALSIPLSVDELELA